MTKVKNLKRDDVFKWDGQDYIYRHIRVMKSEKDIGICWDVWGGLPVGIPVTEEVEKIGTLSEIIKNAKVKTPTTVSEVIPDLGNLIEQLKLYQASTADREAAPSVRKPAGGGAFQHIYGKGTADYNNGSGLAR